MKKILTFLFMVMMIAVLIMPAIAQRGGRSSSSSSSSGMGRGGSSYGGGRSSYSSTTGGGMGRNSGSYNSNRSSYSSTTGGGMGRQSGSYNSSGGASSRRVLTPSRTSTTYTPGSNSRPIGTRIPTSTRSSYSTINVGGRTAYYYPGYGYTYVIGGPVVGYYSPPVYAPVGVYSGPGFGTILLYILGGVVVLVILVALFSSRS